MRAGCRYLGLLIRRRLKEFKRAAVRSDKTGLRFSAMIHLAAAPCGDIARSRRVDLFGASIGQVLPLAPFGGSNKEFAKRFPEDEEDLIQVVIGRNRERNRIGEPDDCLVHGEIEERSPFSSRSSEDTEIGEADSRR